MLVTYWYWNYIFLECYDLSAGEMSYCTNILTSLTWPHSINSCKVLGSAVNCDNNYHTPNHSYKNNSPVFNKSLNKTLTNQLNLRFVSPCFIIYSNKSTNQMHQSLSFIVCFLNTAQHVSGIPTPNIKCLSTAVTASGLPLERGGSSVVGRGQTDHCYYLVPTVNQRRLLQLISSWWWAWRCPKHVELYLKYRQ
jgi:hypothetical protein